MMRIEPTLREKKHAWHTWMFTTSCRVCLVVVTLLFGVLSIVQTSSSATKGYEMSDLQRRIASLQHETGSIDVQIAEYRSMESIQERLKGMDMVPVKEISYIAPANGTMARR